LSQKYRICLQVQHQEWAELFQKFKQWRQGLHVSFPAKE